MFKSMKRIIKWAGKYKGHLYLGSVFSLFQQPVYGDPYNGCRLCP